MLRRTQRDLKALHNNVMDAKSCLPRNSKWRNNDFEIRKNRLARSSEKKDHAFRSWSQILTCQSSAVFYVNAYRGRTIVRIIKYLTLVCLVIVLGAFAASSFRARSETSVTPARANQQIHHRLEIPLGSSDVDYYSVVTYSIADFSISRNKFLAWAEARGWQLLAVSQDDSAVFQYAAARTADPMVIKTGLVFDARDGDFGFSGAYDNDTGRATVSFSTR